MRILMSDFVRDGPGSAKLKPEDDDDLWHAYNLIATGDTVTALTYRKVHREVAGTDTTKKAERIKMELEVKVEDVDYEKDGFVMRVRGRNVIANEHVEVGQSHTLELEVKRPFVLKKEVWDSLDLDRLKQASDPSGNAELAVVLMQEGLANIFLVGRSVTNNFAEIQTSIPRKHGHAIAAYSFALENFFGQVMKAFVRHINFNVVKCVVIASPGFTKDQFHRHLLLEAERNQMRNIIENKSRIVLVHTNSGYRHSLGEVLDTPNVMKMIKDTQAAKEVKALSDFFAMLSYDTDRACYGPKHVEIAHERQAIQTLLITDAKFRNQDIKTRKQYVDFVESVKDLGGEVCIFSSMHVSGEQLAQITGIAAILRFPLPELDDIEM